MARTLARRWRSTRTAGPCISTAALGVGAHTIKVLFQPSGTGVEASRAALSQRVEKATTATKVSVAPDPTVAGQNATFTATVTPVAPAAGVPTGSVQFADDDGTPIGPPQPLVAGTATIVASAGAGDYNVHATYTGDGNFAGSAGNVPQACRPRRDRDHDHEQHEPGRAGRRTDVHDHRDDARAG